jgi:hypothetical protein
MHAILLRRPVNVALHCKSLGKFARLLHALDNIYARPDPHRKSRRVLQIQVQ